MKNYSVRATITANIGGFTKNMSAVERKLQSTKGKFDEFGDGAKKNAEKLRLLEDAAENVGQKLLATGLAVGTGLFAMVKTVADFERALSHYQAVAKSTDYETKQVGETAMRVGRQFGISATEAVGAAEALNKAGVSTADILGGAMHGALVLAASDNIDVADAAETAAIAMNQFGLKGKDVGHIADLLAAGSAEAVGNVGDLSWALRQVGLSASSSGFSIEETTAALSAFAAVGLIGSDAGTSFKSMLMAIQGPTSVARKEMDKYGLSFYDANGNMKSVIEISDELQTKLGGLTEEQRKAAMSIIFGQDAIRAATELYKQGGDGIRDWIRRTNQAGYAAELAAAKLDNLYGDLDKLRVSIENGMIRAGGGMNDVLRFIVQGLTAFSDGLANVPGPLLGLVTGLATATGAVALLSGAVVLGAPKIAAYRAAMAALGTASGRTAKMVGLASKAIKGMSIIGGALIGIEALNQMVKQGGTSTEELVNQLQEVKSAVDLINGVEVQHMGVFGMLVDGGAGNTIKPFVKDVDEFRHKLDRLNDGFLNLQSGDFGRIIFGGIAEGMPEFEAGLDKITDALAQLADSGNIAAVQTQLKNMQTEFDLTDEEMLQIINRSPELKAALTNFATNEGLLLADDMGVAQVAVGKLLDQTKEGPEAIDPLKESLDEVGVSVEGAVTDMEKFLELLFQTGVLTRDVQAAEDEFTAAVQGVDKAINDQIKSLQQKYIDQGYAEQAALNMATAEWKSTNALDKNTESGRANRAMMRDMADKGQAYVESLAKQGAGNHELVTAMQGTYNGMMESYRALGLNKDEADRLTRKLLGIPPDVSIDTWMDTEAKRIADDTKRSIDAIPTYKRTDIEIYTTKFETINRMNANPKDKSRYAQAPGGAGGSTMYTGGVIPKFAGGGVLPGIAPWAKTVDNLLAMNEYGRPIAVRSGEMVVNEDATRENLKWLKAINAGLNMDAFLSGIAGFYDGGVVHGVSGASYQPQQQAQPAGRDWRQAPINITIEGVDTNNTQKVASALLWELDRAKLGGVYAEANL